MVKAVAASPATGPGIYSATNSGVSWIFFFSMFLSFVSLLLVLAIFDDPHYYWRLETCWPRLATSTCATIIDLDGSRPPRLIASVTSAPRCRH
jgi:hypothetical protein